MSKDKNFSSFFQLLVGASSIVACIAAILVVPEVRKLAGLDTSPSAQITEVPSFSENPVLPIANTEISTANIIDIKTPTATITNTPTRAHITITEQELDLSIGAGNWECIYGDTDSVIIDAIPPNFVVQFPFTKIYDNQIDKSYYLGETVPNKIMAVAKLEGSLPNNYYCPTERTKLTEYSIFSIFAASNRGSGFANWECISQNSKAVKLDVPNAFVVNGAIAFAEQNNIRVEKGYTLQSGTAIIWFEYEIMPGVCS